MKSWTMGVLATLIALAVMSGHAALASGDGTATGLSDAALVDAARNVQAAGQDRVPAPAPGVMEFSGRLVARPLSTAVGAARGADAAEVAVRAQRARDALAPVAIRIYPEVDEFIIPVPDGLTEPEAIARMMASGDYDYVTPDWMCYPVSGPNDPLYPNQWHHVVMQSPLAWYITQGSAQIICAFVDTGIDLTHPDLAPRLVLGYNSVTGIPQDFGGDVSDVNGHGTAVAGSAAAIGNNGLGVAGIGWNLRIMPIRTSNSSGGGAYMSNILAGARWAAENGARVVSASYTGVSDPSVQTTGAYIRGLGKIFLFAAGNNSANLAFHHPDVIVVAATDSDDNLAGFSAYGQAIDVAAPGVDVWTTRRFGDYGPATGTSFATPITNAVLGMIWSVNPDLTAAQVESILFASCDDLGPPGEDNYFGHGRVNLFRAVRDAAATLGAQPPFAVPDRATAVLASARAIDVLANDFDVAGGELEIVSFDAVGIAGGTVVRAPAAGPDGRDLLVFTPAALGVDAFAYTIRGPTGLEASATVTVTVLHPSTLRQPASVAASRPGLLVRYYALPPLSQLPNFSLLTPYASEVVPRVFYPSTEGNFAGSGRADDVGAVFTGYVFAPAPDVYTFYTTSDDGSALWIGDVRVVDNDGLHGMQERSGTIGLGAGWHPFRIEFFERGGGAGLIARMQGGGADRQVIPAMWLREGSCVGDWDQSGSVDSADIAAFVADWLQAVAGQPPAGLSPADVNGDGVVSSADISAFLAAWMASLGGC